MFEIERKVQNSEVSWKETSRKTKDLEMACGRSEKDGHWGSSASAKNG